MIDDAPRELLVDAGPLIGLIDVRDDYHDVATRGFRHLLDARTRLTVPLPILFEVYKRIAYDVNPDAAHRAIDLMVDGFEIEIIEREDILALRSLVLSMSWWEGSLEDATLAMIGLRRDLPIWTYNYRDFSAFKDIQLWSPG